MKKFIALALALVAAAHAAAQQNEGVVVLRDTRQQDEYTSAVVGLEGCPMPASHGVKKDGDCEVTKARYVKAGELLTRNPQTGTCTHTSWQQTKRQPLSHQGHDVSAPEHTTRQEIYPCHANGLAVSR